MNNGNCADFLNYYNCTCDPGYQGNNCESGYNLVYFNISIFNVIVYFFEFLSI